MKTPTNMPADRNGPDGIFVELRDLPDETLWSILPEWVGEFERDGAFFDHDVKAVRDFYARGLISKDLGDVHGAINECLWNSSSVLITGETGTGKEVVARCIHELGTRAEGPFKAINCSGIPAELLESEMFGHEAGAFTGAARTGKDGWVAAADGGTLFLDEVGDMPGPLQAKLLRFLNDSTFTRLGGTEEKKVDVRIISATSRDIQKLLNEGQFRADLYYRLNTMEIAVKPLRDRLEDIPILLYHFVTQYNKAIPRDRRVHRVSLRVLEEASFYGWPGNVRHLRSLVERGINISSAVAVVYRKEDRGVVRPGLYRIFTEEEQTERRNRATRVLVTLGLDPPNRRSLPDKEGKRASFLRGSIALPRLLQFSLWGFLRRSDSFVLPEDRRLWTKRARSEGSMAGTARDSSADTDIRCQGSIEPNMTPTAEGEERFESILDLSAEEVRRGYARGLLKRHRDNAAAAGRAAGVDPKTIQRWATPRKG
jgi:transcriptional regulator with PAS, ATPase and Fis domain